MRRLLLFTVCLSVAPLPARASSIVLFGNDSNVQLEAFLEANGHTVTNHGFSVPNAGFLAGQDVMIALRNIQGNVNGFSATGAAAVQSFVNAGGLLIAEWNATEYVVDTNGHIDADGGPDVFFGAQPIVFAAAGVGRGLAAGINNPFQDGTGSDNQWSLANLGPSIEVLATRPGDIPVMIGATVGQGYVLINSLEWADSFGSANADTEGWLLNADGMADTAEVPKPASLALLGCGLACLVVATRRSP